MKNTFLAFVLAGSIFSANLFAIDINPGSIEVGPYVGYQFLDSFSGSEPKDNLIYGARLGIFMTEKDSFEASYQINATETEVGNLDAQFRSLRFNLLHHLLPGKRVNPFLTIGLGWLHADIDNAVARNELGVNVGTGLRIMFTDHFGVRLDGRYVYAEVADSNEHNFEGALGLSFLFGGEAALDQDGDGISDKKDECSGTPSGASVNEKGCPSDDDSDGVFNGIDKCSATMKGLLVDNKGCQQDTDGDKVPDGPDECPGTPSGAKVDGTGCPYDKDKDGVSDSMDKCPNTIPGATVDELGCASDADGDNVGDHLDLCPNTAEGTAVDSKGCPLQSQSRGVLKGVNFRTGSAQLTPNSLTILKKVAAELIAFPKVKVEVQGHTDSTGSAAANLAISTKRATAVMEYLVAQSIARDRLVARGYGEDQPIASNKTSTGRAQNRRVEMKWLD